MVYSLPTGRTKWRLRAKKSTVTYTRQPPQLPNQATLGTSHSTLQHSGTPRLQRPQIHRPGPITFTQIHTTYGPFLSSPTLYYSVEGQHARKKKQAKVGEGHLLRMARSRSVLEVASHPFYSFSNPLITGGAECIYSRTDTAAAAAISLGS